MIIFVQLGVNRSWIAKGGYNQLVNTKESLGGAPNTERSFVSINEYWMMLGVVLAFFDLDVWSYHGVVLSPPAICVAVVAFSQQASRIIAGYLLGYSFFAGKLLQFLLGSVMFTQLLAKYVHGIDLRIVGSKNLGVSNLIRAGVPVTQVLIISAFELGKGALAVYFGGIEGLPWVVAGHLACPWTRDGVGGKGVAPFLGASLLLAPVTTVLGILFYAYCASNTLLPEPILPLSVRIPHTFACIVAVGAIIAVTFKVEMLVAASLVLIAHFRDSGGEFRL
jgi:glycerol-3-phosphate acyltransferase PlsY